MTRSTLTLKVGPQLVIFPIWLSFFGFVPKNKKQYQTQQLEGEIKLKHELYHPLPPNQINFLWLCLSSILQSENRRSVGNLCQWLVATTLYFVLKFPFQQSKVESHFDPFTEEDLLSKRKKTVTSRHYLSFLYLSVVCSHSLVFHQRFLKCQSARLPSENHEESSSSRLLTICQSSHCS